jgi:hypothetical protein
LVARLRIYLQRMGQKYGLQAFNEAADFWRRPGGYFLCALA